MTKFLKIIPFLLLMPLLLHSTAAQEPSAPKKAPTILVTLKPIYSLTHAIMQGVGEPLLLMTGAADPHHFSLTPSHSSLIKKADLVIWIGPIMESFMIKPLAAQKKNQLPLMATKGLTLLSRNTQGEITLEDPQSSAIDPHMWLDINNAILMVQEITYHLKALDLENANIYLENARALVEKLRAFKLEIDKKAQLLEGFNFISFHDAYGYLEHSYTLKNKASGILKGHGTPSLKAFSTIRHLIKEHHIRCMLVDPHHPSEVAQRLSKEFQMSLYNADPLGIEIDSGPEHYFTLIRHFIQQLNECNQKNSPKK